MVSNRKKPEPPQEYGAPAWMNTYGDMVTLVLTFFVLLFSFSTIDAKKWEEIVNSFSGQRLVVVQPLDPKAADSNEIIRTTPTPAITPEPSINNDIKERFDELYEKIQKHISENGLDLQLNVSKDDNLIVLRITDSALFDSGRDVIRTDALELLQSIVEIFDEYETAIKLIQIEGHTDNVPIHSAKFDSNWDLSTSRAVRVVQYFIDHSGISPMKYAASGYGEYHPVASNDTEEGKTKNRRVDFVITSTEYID